MALRAESFLLLLFIAIDASSPLYLNKEFGTDVGHSGSTNIGQERVKGEHHWIEILGTTHQA